MTPENSCIAVELEKRLGDVGDFGDIDCDSLANDVVIVVGLVDG